LALAAYNCGPGNVRKAIRRSGGKTNFWEIEKFLPRETRNYVPKFIAISYIMQYYTDYNLVPKMPEDHMFNTATAQVYRKISLRKVSSELGVDLRVVKKLNPSYIRNYIPASKEGIHRLTLPQSQLYEFVNANTDATLLSSPYTLKSKEIRKKELVKARQSISVNKIPKIWNYQTMNSTEKLNKISPKLARTLSYRTTKLDIRESLKDVAIRTNTTVDELLELNKFDKNNLPTVGCMVKYQE